MEDYPVKGLFADICAYYWFKDCSITQAMLKRRFKDVDEMLKLLLSNDIIKLNQEDDKVSISFLDEQYLMLSGKRKHLQYAGSLGGKQRSSNAQAMLKQRSSYKDKDKDKDKDILREREDFEKIEILKGFQERRFKDPNKEYDRFIAHYNKTNWKDSNGNDITNKVAAAKFWDEKPDIGKKAEKPKSFNINEIWQMVVTDFLKEVNNEDATTMILDIKVIELKDKILSVQVDNKSSVDLLETTYFDSFSKCFRKYFPEPHHLNYKLNSIKDVTQPGSH